MMSLADPVLHEYLWLVVVGAFASFLFGYGTGSNDVANAFGTSVGAKTLTLRQAVIIAALFEFTGAMVLGRVSTSTIAGGIADINAFLREPEMFMYGMVCALAVCGVWQIVASYFELNVSSTHSIIGAIIGFGLIYDGNNAVLWKVDDPSSFPPYKGVVPIIVSWFFSPVFTALVSGFFFLCIRTLVLRRTNAYQLSFWVLPPAVTLTVFICIYFVFTKGAKKTIAGEDSDWTDGKAAWIAACVSAGVCLLVVTVMLPIMRYRANAKFSEEGKAVEAAADAEKGAEKAAKQAEVAMVVDPNEPKWKTSLRNTYRKAVEAATHGTSVDIHEIVEEDELVGALHANAEVFDPKVEYAFQYLQVFSAICVVFSHGAGEVGYMAGPLATIWSGYTEGKLTKNVTAPAWVVLIGAIGLVIGLATYGYKVTRAMGVRLAKLSPTRGFCAELATALVIMIASQQCITGGIIGVGMLEGKLGVNWLFFARQFSSWIATLFIAGLGTAALFAQGVYTPSRVSGLHQVYYEDQVSATAVSIFDNYRASLLTYARAANASLLPQLTTSQLSSMNSTLVKLSAETKAAGGTSRQTVDPSELFGYLNTALSLVQSNSILTVGQVALVPGAALCNNNVTADIQANDRPPAAPGPIPPPQLGAQAPPWGRWLDRDTNACLNFQRFGESVQHPLELCSWDDLEALPPIGKKYRQRYKLINDRLTKVRQRMHRSAEYRRGINGRARNNP
ncbi:hypothetical protein QJQ45_010711 [Haematococcus lacustris]|nr:hypothetical protein QJQ45_010711 [Haematococcus lacustris]